MQRYRSHKIVEAGKILSEDKDYSDGAVDLELNDGAFLVDREWYDKHSDGRAKSLVGGYFVRYEDGYVSWSPAEAFENGYTLIEAES